VITDEGLIRGEFAEFIKEFKVNRRRAPVPKELTAGLGVPGPWTWQSRKKCSPLIVKRQITSGVGPRLDQRSICPDDLLGCRDRGPRMFAEGRLVFGGGEQSETPDAADHSD